MPFDKNLGPARKVSGKNGSWVIHERTKHGVVPKGDCGLVSRCVIGCSIQPVCAPDGACICPSGTCPLQPCGLWLYYSHISLAALQPHIALLEPHIANAVATCFGLLAQLCHQTGLLTESAAVLLGAASQKHTKHSSLCIGIQEALCNRATGRARECDLEALTNVSNTDFSVCLGVHCSQIRCTARPQCLRAWME